MQAGLSPELEPLTFDALTDWKDDDHLAAFTCFQNSARRMVKKPYTPKSLGISGVNLQSIGRIALGLKNLSSHQARWFFEENFLPARFRPGSLPPQSEFAGLLTGYFEPELKASRVKTKEYTHPIYRRPDDLIDVMEKNRPDGFPSHVAFGRKTAHGIEEYFDRGQIQNGALAGRDLEIFWLKSPIDVFFAHIQGSAHLRLEKGENARISFAAKSGHSYTPIGKTLVERGELELFEVNMQSIINWLKTNPDSQDEIMASNRSYIFFQEVSQPDHNLGPLAAAGVALTPGRSLAVDRFIHTFGTPIWTQTQKKLPAHNHPMSRLLIAQDTGSAIIGAQRGDLFLGSGEKAGVLAGMVNHLAKMIVLVPIENGN